jgi:hypothetical protein
MMPGYRGVEVNIVHGFMLLPHMVAVPHWSYMREGPSVDDILLPRVSKFGSHRLHEKPVPQIAVRSIEIAVDMALLAELIASLHTCRLLPDSAGKNFRKAFPNRDHIDTVMKTR